MAKMLDLTALKEQTLDITLLDGTIIKIRKPSQKLLMDFVAIQNEIQGASMDKQIELIGEMTKAILNNNTAGKKFDSLDDDYDLSMQQAIVAAYSEFINEVMGQKN